MASFLLLAAIPATTILVLLLYSARGLVIEWLRISFHTYFKLSNLPGPKAYPIIGCAWQFEIDVQAFTRQLMNWYHEYYRNGRHGLVKFWIGPVPAVFIIGPEHVKEILESNTNITKSTFYDMVSGWIGTGLLTSAPLNCLNTNEKWFARRKMLTPTFHFNVLKSYSDVFARQGQIMVEVLEKYADTGREFDLFPYSKRCALDIICETAMGTCINAQTGGSMEYVNGVTRVSDLIFTYLRLPWNWIKPVWYASGNGFEYDRLVKETNDFTRKVILERRVALEEEGLLDTPLNPEEVKKRKLAFLDMLLMMQKANALSDEDIREEVDTFMFEGHDTTATNMAFTIWMLGQFPEYQVKVHEELDAIFGEDTQRLPTEADTKKMSYLDRCVKEALRLFPSVPIIARKLTEHLKYGDTVLPRGMSVLISPFATQHDNTMYEHSDTFYPDHFTPEKTASRHPYAFFPFAAGPRNCIGQKFALAEKKYVLSWFFRRYRVESAVPFPGSYPQPELILNPGDGVLVRIFRRKPGQSSSFSISRTPL